VRVTQRVPCNASAHSGSLGRAVQSAADPCRGARAAARRAAPNAKQSADRKVRAQLAPPSKLRPAPAVHPDLAALTAFATSDQERAAVRVEVGLGERERLADRQPAAPDTTIMPRSLRPSGSSPAASMTAMISSTVGGVQRVTKALVAGRQPVVKLVSVAGERSRPAQSNGGTNFMRSSVWTTINAP
jgi:hypothetical protein